MTTVTAERTRRELLGGAAATAASVVLAGCSFPVGAGSVDGGEASGGAGPTTTPTASGTAEGTATETGGDFGGWFDDVDGFDGVVDRTGTDEVGVTVGAEGNGGAFAFAPAAVRVSSGTTVVWEWTGEGGQHNVVAEDGSFESDLTGEAGHTFEHTFDSTGTVRYVCVPHRSLGMKGVVVVG